MTDIPSDFQPPGEDDNPHEATSRSVLDGLNSYDNRYKEKEDQGDEAQCKAWFVLEVVLHSIVGIVVSHRESSAVKAQTRLSPLAAASTRQLAEATTEDLLKVKLKLQRPQTSGA